MAEELCVGCSGASQFFCLCRKEKPTYCGECLVGHITAGGAHLTSPLAAAKMVTKATDLERYNVRLQTVDSLARILSSLSQRLDLEQTTAAASLKAIETDQVSALKSAFARIKTDLASLFQSLQSSISRIRSELVSCENDPSIVFSRETHLFLSTAMHLPDGPVECVNIPVEVARRVLLSFSSEAVDFSKSFETVMRGKRCRMQDCNRCEGLRAGLEVAEKVMVTEFDEDTRMFSTYISELPSRMESEGSRKSVPKRANSSRKSQKEDAADSLLL